ncbi:MAG: 16S rRNA (cytosine(1402)-N(4))-methyltransferase RsmH [Myxococcota bacterium]
MKMTGFHQPVLLHELVAAVAPTAGDVVVDCTLGGGGHAEAVLQAADCRVVGIDRDPAALAEARARLQPFGDRFVAVHARFSEVERVLEGLALPRVQAIYADFGVSSHQLDTAERGFSFRASGPLDMRMDPTAATTAADIVNGWGEAELADLLKTFGEERRAARVASRIVAGRPFADTAALAKVVAEAVGGPPGRIHPATRTFQALRIAVNDELGEITRWLPAALGRLAPGGRLAAITFHSLEDRIVKRFLAEAAGKGRPRDAYGNPVGEVTVRLGRDVTPSADDPNPRARSARLRVATRLSAQEGA